jgi:hemolysin activation/secretion protein
VFEFQNTVQFKDPKITGKGRLSVLFVDSSTNLQSLTVYETDTLQKVQSVEFIKDKSNLTANVTLTFPYFMLKAFSLSDPVRVVVDAYKLSASTKDSVPTASSKETDSSEVSEQPETKKATTVSEGSSANEISEQPEAKKEMNVTEKSPEKETKKQMSEPSSTQLPEEMEDEADTLTFPIDSFEVSNNTVLSSMEIKNTLKPYTGPRKTAEDVEKARNALERYYHKQGYPTALVNIPEQTVEDGIVRLEIIESTVRRVRVTGNRYFTMASIQKKLPSFKTGEILYLPKIQEELTRINRNPDIKVVPVLIPGKKLGTIDVELKVKDKLPLHGSLELNNRSSHATTDLRLNGIIRYDNLWQKEHSISFQYQISPQNANEVEAIAGSYVLSAPWNEDHMLAIYGVWSDSNIAFGEGFQSIGKGTIYGVRNVMPLPGVENYNHSLSLGFDYKDYDDDLSFTDGTDTIETPITYLPFSFSYNSSLNHLSGTTKFSGGVNILFRGLVGGENEFEDKRYKSRSNYVYTTIGVERYQTLPKGFQLFLKCDGQIADQPLPSNEQFSAGGLNSVRGYKETEEAGDNAIHGIVELLYPELAKRVGLPDWCNISPNIFFDIAAMRIKNPLPGEDQPDTLAGAGAGIRGRLSRFFEYELSWGVALRETGRTEEGSQRLYFVAKGQF